MRLCRLMCGRASPFRQRLLHQQGYAFAVSGRGGASPGFKFNSDGKAEPFRTSSGKAAKPLSRLSYTYVTNMYGGSAANSLKLTVIMHFFEPRFPRAARHML